MASAQRHTPELPGCVTPRAIDSLRWAHGEHGTCGLGGRSALPRQPRSTGRGTCGEDHPFVQGSRKARGSTAIQHRYEGEFFLDPEQVWRREDGPDQAGELRSAIVFRLIRADGRAAAAPPEEGPQPRAETPTAETTVKVVAAEGHHVDEFGVSGRQAGTAYRRERALEKLLVEELACQGVTAGRLEITIRGQSKPLLTDTWDEKHRELYEAKGTVARAKVREAVGQLLDYRRHITPPPATCTVLLPSDPGGDLTQLIHGCGFDLVYLEGSNKLVRSSAT